MMSLMRWVLLRRDGRMPTEEDLRGHGTQPACDVLGGHSILGALGDDALWLWFPVGEARRGALP
jgi:hypothetical protein